MIVWTLMLAIYESFKTTFKYVIGMRNDCQSKRQLDGKVVIITGANTGIGKETAYQLSLRNAKVIIGCRDMKRAENAIKHIKQLNPNANISAVKLDLSSFASIREFAKQIALKESKIDILVNNAGIGLCTSQTEDGFEIQFGTNYLGHFLLTLSLMPLLRNSPKARIINTGSMSYFMGQIDFKATELPTSTFSQFRMYASSKLAIILFTRELAKRLGPDSNVTVYCADPGMVATDVLRYTSSLYRKLILLYFNSFCLNVEQGCQTALYCALEESLDKESGHYYSNCFRIDNLYSNAMDDKCAEQLWDWSCDLIKQESKLS